MDRRSRFEAFHVAHGPEDSGYGEEESSWMRAIGLCEAWRTRSEFLRAKNRTQTKASVRDLP